MLFSFDGGAEVCICKSSDGICLAPVLPGIEVYGTLYRTGVLWHED
jgi:hypothetical protein